ncbi:MAG: hypothetical protein ACP5K2_00950 [bacterium]
MKKLVVGILVVSILLLPVLALADEETGLESRKMVDTLLSVFSNLLTEEMINELRAQGYGYGEIAIMCLIASQSGTSLTDVINYAKENNLGWGEVANHFGVKLSKLGLVLNQKDRGESAGISYLRHEMNKDSDKGQIQQETQQQIHQQNQQENQQVQLHIQQQTQQHIQEGHGSSGGRK